MVATNVFKSQLSQALPWQVLRRYRWWMAVGCGVLGILVERLEHHLEINIDLVEIIGYGLVLPIVMWWFITRLAHLLEQGALTAKSHSQYQKLRDQLDRCHDWTELTRFVARLPGELLPLTHAVLYTYDHSKARFELAAEWDGLATAQSVGCPTFECRACVLTQQPHFRANLDEYCQPLTYQNLLIGTLNLHFRSGAVIDRTQLAFLDSLAPKIALALAVLIAQPQRLTLVRAEARLAEQRHLAYELHESLAQHVAYLHLNLDRIVTDGASLAADALQQELISLREVAGEAYQQVRNQLMMLRPRSGQDLIQSLRQYVRLFTKRHHVRVSLITSGEPTQLPVGMHAHVFSLVRESLNNVQRHARAYEAHVILTWAADQLVLVVTDDGVGFEPDAALAPGHHGLSMLREHAAALNGQLHIHSAPNHGTRLIFHLPLEPVAPLAREASF